MKPKIGGLPCAVSTIRLPLIGTREPATSGATAPYSVLLEGARHTKMETVELGVKSSR